MSSIDAIASSSVSAEPAPAIPPANLDQARADTGRGASTRTRRPRGEGGAGLTSRASEFRDQAKKYRSDAKGTTGSAADNLNARADRADTAADRLEAAAARAGGGTQPETAPAAPTDPKDDAASPPAVSSAKNPKEMADKEDKAAQKAASTSPITLEAEQPDVAEVDAPEIPQIRKKEDSVQGSGDNISLKATDVPSSGSWRKMNVGGRSSMVWDAASSNYGSPDPNEALSFNIRPSKSGVYNVDLQSARLPSVMSSHEAHENDRGNDVFFQVTDLETGEVIQRPTKLFTYFGSQNETYKSGDTFDSNHRKSPAQIKLDGGSRYRIDIIGRSDGYALNEVNLTRRGS